MSVETLKIMTYLEDMGLPQDKTAYLEIVNRLEANRKTDIAQGKIALPLCAIPGIALSMLQKQLVAA